LIRKKAIEIIVSKIGNESIISANGFISRDLFNVKDKKTNFYMIGSMGLASSIGLGLAIKKPTKKIFVLDGDGNILMNFGSLVTITSIKPKNLVHIILDNSIHESTGGQPTASNKIKLNNIINSMDFKVFQTNSEKDLESMIKKSKTIQGPIVIIVKIEAGKTIGKRINIKPEKIKERFMKELK
tara:strand:- start:1233 stop:1784 length:552 start_codon:yes stop_codon:yes gene_type:complete